MRFSSVVEELLSFVCLNFNDFSVLSHNLISSGWNFMKLILSIYDHSLMMIHVKLHEEVISCREVIVLFLLRFQRFFLSTAITYRSKQWMNFMKLIQSIYNHSVMMHV